jgi:DNA-directed RNA polymerase subunit RPC12/RpoP
MSAINSIMVFYNKDVKGYSHSGTQEFKCPYCKSRHMCVFLRMEAPSGTFSPEWETGTCANCGKEYRYRITWKHQ